MHPFPFPRRTTKLYYPLTSLASQALVFFMNQICTALSVHVSPQHPFATPSSDQVLLTEMKCRHCRVSSLPRRPSSLASQRDFVAAPRAA